MLVNQSVLICEDEAFVALDLAAAVEDAGGQVVGPAATVREALTLLTKHRITAAVLDVNLADRDVTPVAEVLLERGVPLVVQTGRALPPPLKELSRTVPVLSKPVPALHIVQQLAQIVGKK